MSIDNEHILWGLELDVQLFLVLTYNMYVYSVKLETCISLDSWNHGFMKFTNECSLT